MWPKNFKNLKYWANDKSGFTTSLIYNTAEDLTKSQFAQILKNGSDIYEYVQLWIFLISKGLPGQKNKI